MKLFEEYGKVFQLNIHRDKASGESKGEKSMYNILLYFLLNAKTEFC